MNHLDYDKPISVKDLLLRYKALEPISESSVNELKRIEGLDVSKFSEADVREEIITPILRVLGYNKGSYFSVDREKSLKIVKAHNYIDYNLTLFDENFWLIEAKKPESKNRKHFGHKDVIQALQYAAHPDINAALMALCDGKLIEIFDREHSLEKPIVAVRIENLRSEIDKLRILLSPWQNWFFQKRRIARIADKVFDNEHSLKRAEEIVDDISRRASSKRAKILDNFRSRVSSQQHIDEWLEHLRNAEERELTEVWFFNGGHTLAAYKAMADNLVTKILGHNSGFVFKLLPEQPRDANAEFCCSVLFFLMTLEKEMDGHSYLPSWLGQREKGKVSLRQAISILISYSLSSFENDKGRQVMMLMAFAYRRLSKLLVNLKPDIRSIGKMRHLRTRFEEDELSWTQMVSSPEGGLLNFLNECEMMAPGRVLKEFQNDRNDHFNTEVAATHLRSIWASERYLLKANPDYPKLRREQSLGEIHPTENMQVTYDYLGHLTLCLISEFPDWREYTLAHHRPEIEQQAAQGMFMAKNWLGLEGEKEVPYKCDKSQMARRFFLGDQKLMEELYEGYGLKDRFN